MHQFQSDFYGSMLKLVILGYIRPEKNFKSLGKFQILNTFLTFFLQIV